MTSVSSAISTSIFCRNVLIYFDQATKIDIFNRLSKVHEPDGYLFLGAAETVVGLTDIYRPCPERRGVYLPNANASYGAPVPAAGAGWMSKPRPALLVEWALCRDRGRSLTSKKPFEISHSMGIAISP